jgi:hypothetical protein
MSSKPRPWDIAKRGALVALLSSLGLAFLYLATNAVLKIVAGLVSGYAAVMAVSALFSYKIVLLSLLASALFLARYAVQALRETSPNLRWAAPRALWGTLAVFAILLVEPVVSPRFLDENSFGYVTSSTKNTERVFEHWSDPSLPAMHVRSNAEGYRDEDWDPESASRRVLLVGDSMVWGACIPDKSGMLDHQLELALNQGAVGPPWEVINIGLMPSGLPYYVEALDRISAYAEPVALVVSYLARTDTYPLDVPVLEQASGWPLNRLLRAFGVLEDLMMFNAQEQWQEGSTRRALLASSYERHVTERWARFVSTLEARKLPLIVWEPMGREALFDAYREHPLLTFLAWEDLPVRPGDAPAAAGKAPAPWWETPGYYVENDGHPTPLANQRFAEGIARALRDAVPRVTPEADAHGH